MVRNQKKNKLMNKIVEIKMPRFLLAEEPQDRVFKYIYSPHYLSLVLIIPEEIATVTLNKETIKKPRKTYRYGNEVFELVLVQNNVEATGGAMSPVISETEFLDEAWEWYADYLKWEDSNIDNETRSNLN